MYMDYLNHVHKYYSPWSKKFFPKIVDEVSKNISKRNFRIMGAFSNNKLIAFVNASVHYSKIESRYNAWINDIYVSPKFRGKGVAKNLIQEIEIWAKKRGAKEIRFGTSVKNKPALKTWKKLGYKEHIIDFIKKI